MDNLPKNISFSQSELNKYLILTTDMVIFDLDFKNENHILELCNNFYKKYKYDLRIYKTSNGYRIFLTNKKFNVISDFNILNNYTKELDADERYLIFNLKKSFKIFPIRIAPKKINAINVTTIFQLIDEFKEYQNNPNESVTRYITSIGKGIILEEFKEFIIQHDEITKAFNKDSILV